MSTACDSPKVIVDGNNLIWRYASTMSPNMAYASVLRRILDRWVHPGEVKILVMEPVEKERVDGYKEHRKEVPQGVKDTHRMVLKAATSPRFAAKFYLTPPDVEADRVIAGMAAAAVSEASGTVYIVSSDKDLCQLVSDPSVKVIKPEGGQIYDEAAVLKRYGVEPRHLGAFLALAGDKSDGISGVRGFGKGYAAAVFRGWKTPGPFHPKQLKELIEGRELPHVSRSLQTRLYDEWDQFMAGYALTNLIGIPHVSLPSGDGAVTAEPKVVIPAWKRRMENATLPVY